MDFNEHIELTEDFIRSTVEKHLPEFVEAVKNKKGDTFILQHQDAFAADYQFQEVFLLGMAIKYAGLYGRELRIFGFNGKTL